MVQRFYDDGNDLGDVSNANDYRALSTYSNSGAALPQGFYSDPTSGYNPDLSAADQLNFGAQGANPVPGTDGNAADGGFFGKDGGYGNWIDGLKILQGFGQLNMMNQSLQLGKKQYGLARDSYIGNDLKATKQGNFDLRSLLTSRAAGEGRDYSEGATQADYDKNKLTPTKIT